MKQLIKKQVILKPVVSEKSLGLYNNLKVCTFEVSRDSSKKQIAYDFENMFGIKPTKVSVIVGRNLVNTRNKKTYQVSTNRRYEKKAYITIGDNKLDIFENIK
jgi:large subunit ribosomal protein L23